MIDEMWRVGKENVWHREGFRHGVNAGRMLESCRSWSMAHRGTQRKSTLVCSLYFLSAFSLTQALFAKVGVNEGLWHTEDMI